MSRRKFLTSFAIPGPREEPARPRPVSSGPATFTNALLRTHEDQEVRFYEDLIKDRHVLISFMDASSDEVRTRVTARLVQIHEALKDRMGKNLFMYSITQKPEKDDPAALKSYAEMHGALLPGWTFLTGDLPDIAAIRDTLFKTAHIPVNPQISSHASHLLIINDATRRWLYLDPLASMYTVLRKISMADSPKSFAEQVEENKKRQEKINQEIELYGYRKTL